MQQRRRIATPSGLGAWRANPLIAVISIIAIALTAVFGGRGIYQAQSAGSEPSPVESTSMSLADYDNVVVDDAAIASQGGEPGPKTVKEFTSENEFSMFGITWQGDNADFAAFVRAMGDDGQWGPWYNTEPIKEVAPSGVHGTEPIYVGPTNRIQVSLAGVDLGIGDDATAADEASLTAVPDIEIFDGVGGPEPLGDEPATEDAPEKEAAPAEPQAESAPEEQPSGIAPINSNYGDIQPVAEAQPETGASGPVAAADLNTVLLSPDLTAGVNESAIELTSNTVGMPKVISRAAWGANENYRNVTYSPPVTAITIHHTAGSNNYTEAAAPGIVRGIQDYHARQLGWRDIGYNALVDKYGNIYEGRAGGLDKAVEGAHVGGFNKNTWGVSLLGNYQTAQPTAVMLDAVGKLAGWRAAVAGFDPTGSSWHQAEFSFSGSRFAAGQGANFPNINSHRDFHYNECPGDYVYNQLGTIRSIAKTRYNEIRQGTIGQTQQNQPTQQVQPNQPSAPSRPNPSQNQTPTPSQQRQQPANNKASLQTIQNAINGDVTAIVAIAGSLAAVLIAAAAKSGVLAQGSSQVGDIEIISGFKVADLPPIIDGIVSLTGNSEIEKTWNQINTAFGPVLGNSRSGIGGSEPIGDQLSSTAFALFDNGIIVSNEKTGTHALWGALADAWAGQGFDVGPLGLPTSNPFTTGGGGELKVNFEGGAITYDPNTNQVRISTN